MQYSRSSSWSDIECRELTDEPPDDEQTEFLTEGLKL